MVKFTLAILFFGFCFCSIAQDTTKISEPDTLGPIEPVYYFETEPEFPGGLDSMNHFLITNLHYPEAAMELGEQGTVYVEFVIDVDGSVTDVVVKRSVTPLLDAEAIRIVSSMPKWKPGTQTGIPIRVRYVIPINFKKAWVK